MLAVSSLKETVRPVSKVGWDVNQVQDTTVDVVSKISCHDFQPYRYFHAY
jgi:hypothetical protein